MIEQTPLVDQGSPPSPSLPSSVHDEDDNPELRAQEEIRQEFQWLAKMLRENRNRGWGTGYRDFVDVLLLLNAVGGLGMSEQPNNRVSDGVFPASIGDFTLSLVAFIDVMDLEHSAATWGNKLTMFFRLKSLYLYSEHIGGIRFRDPAHNQAWDVTRRWVQHRDKVLDESWITKRFGSTELRPLVRSMLQEAYQSEHLPLLSIRFMVLSSDILKGGMEYVEEFD